MSRIQRTRAGGSVAANNSDDQTVDCPAGQVATGGGVRLSGVAGGASLADFVITRNAAEETQNGITPTSWRGDVFHNDADASGGTISWFVSVVCASP